MAIKRRKPLHLTACFGFGAHTETALLSFLHLGNFFHTRSVPEIPPVRSCMIWQTAAAPPTSRSKAHYFWPLCCFSQRDLRTNYLKALLSVVFDQIRTHQQWYN